MPNKPENEKLISRTALGMPKSIFGNDSIMSMGNAWGGTGVPGMSSGGNYSRSPLGQKADK
jgi:hypothetical protein